eukprot:scaffold172889_cov30-Tisochrysis_lutea.AAC.2
MVWSYKSCKGGGSSRVCSVHCHQHQQSCCHNRAADQSSNPTFNIAGPACAQGSRIFCSDATRQARVLALRLPSTHLQGCELMYKKVVVAWSS